MAVPPAYSETFLNSKIRNLMDSGAEITVYTRGKKGNYFFKHRVAPPGNYLMVFYFLPMMARLFLLHPISMFRLWRLCKKENCGIVAFFKLAYFNAHIIIGSPDLLHYEFSVLAHGREMLAAAIKAEMSVSLRGFDVSIYPLKFPGCFDRMFKYLDKVHSISEYFIECFRNYGLPDHIPVYKIPPAIETGIFPIKENAGMLATKVLILTTGRLHWKKGNEYAIRIAADLRDRGLNFEWHFAGDGNNLEMMKFLIKLYHLESHIVLHGRVPHQKVIQLLSQSHIYIQPSVQEGFCNAVLESQCSGLLTIVSNADGLWENVLDQSTGWVVPRRNPSVMADAVMNLFNMSNEERIHLVKVAADRVRQEFDLANQKEAFNKFYGI